MSRRIREQNSEPDTVEKREPPGPRFIVIMMVAIVLIPPIGGIVTGIWFLLTSLTSRLPHTTLGQLGFELIGGLIMAIPWSYVLGTVYAVFGGLYFAIRAELTNWIGVFETILIAILAVAVLPVGGNFEAFILPMIFNDYPKAIRILTEALQLFVPGAIAAALGCRFALIRLHLLTRSEVTP